MKAIWDFLKEKKRSLLFWLVVFDFQRKIPLSYPQVCRWVEKNKLIHDSLSKYYSGLS